MYDNIYLPEHYFLETKFDYCRKDSGLRKLFKKKNHFVFEKKASF